MYVCMLQAGVVKPMNDFAQKFMSEMEEREEILSEAQAAAEAHEDTRCVVVGGEGR